MNSLWRRPRLFGLVCGAAAVALGVAYMISAGAPWRYLFVNLAALALGGAAWLLLGRAGERTTGAGSAVFALALPVMATALFGGAVDGASRWLAVGPVSLQVSLIVLPAMLVLYARRPEPIGTAGMLVVALALALQPDRAMAGVLLAVVLVTRARLAILATAGAAAAFGWTLLAPDALPAVPYVDHILYTAFDVHLLAGAAVLLGTALLLLPAGAGWASGRSERSVLLAFGVCWSAIVAAAALGNYPTPLVGYGGSAVLGYLLSVALLPGRVGAVAATSPLSDPSTSSPGTGSDIAELRVARRIRRRRGVAMAPAFAGTDGK